MNEVFRKVLGVSIAGIILSSIPGQASTNQFVVPGFRGSPQSEAGYWESFNVAYGSPGNVANMPGATSGAVLTQDGSKTAFITGTGNIYDFSDQLPSFTLVDSTPYAVGTVVIQVRTLGSELDPASFLLHYTDSLGDHALAPVFHAELDRGTILGASVSSLLQWDLTGKAISDYAITFKGAGPSISFDALTLDSWNQFTPVPEPSTAAMALAGLGLMLWKTVRKTRTL